MNWFNKAIAALILLIAAHVVLGLVSDTPEDEGEQGAKVSEAVAYLRDIPEVAAVKVESGNHVWIAVRSRPDDLGMIVRGAALKAHKALGAGAHAYITTEAGLQVAPDAEVICSATARFGKVERADC